jgi:hypothetical protein
LKKTRGGWLITNDELRAIETANRINDAIARGKEFFATVYRRVDYHPRVKVLCAMWTPSGTGIVYKVLEGEESGDVQFCWRNIEDFDPLDTAGPR